MKPAELSGTKTRNIWKKKLISLKHTVRIKISETY